MKVIIAGCRDFYNTVEVYEALKSSPFDFVSQIISGGASGVDKSAIEIAINKGIPYVVMPADWDKRGKAAGPIRNRQMAEYADGLVAIWDGKSKGTKNMIDEMQKRKKPVYIHMIGTNI